MVSDIKNETPSAGEVDLDADRVYDVLEDKFGPEDPRSSGYRSVKSFNFESEEIRKVIRRYEGKILDVACGHGLVSAPLIEEGRDLFGLDYNEIAVESAKTRGVKAMRGDAFNMQIDADTYDVVLTTEFIQQYDPQESQKLVRECVRVAKPGGVVIIIWRNGFSLMRQVITKSLRFIDWIKGRPTLKLYDHEFDTVVGWLKPGSVEVAESLSISPILGVAVPGRKSLKARILGTSYLVVLRKVK